MTKLPPTYRERAIATSVNNSAALRDLIVDLADEIDKMISGGKPPAETDETETEDTNETEE